MARPPMPECQRASHRIQLYFTGLEFTAMNETATQRGGGMTVSQWAKSTLLAALQKAVARRLGDVEEYRCPHCGKSIWIPDDNSWARCKRPWRDGLAMSRRTAASIVKNPSGYPTTILER